MTQTLHSQVCLCTATVAILMPKTAHARAAAVDLGRHGGAAGLQGSGMHAFDMDLAEITLLFAGGTHALPAAALPIPRDYSGRTAALRSLVYASAGTGLRKME
eukprot:CAMPEP_0182544178 /NCGR_PEP_ID=MMETSP1323-20130603/32757_1 /TAXON_ID=236787 /ORGANISM="Florenciella parvula, Strain RCC1693" /LENGTH=102 /DNA_ID=CAMNT_0024755183 /DNA_START=85 /DNA_END=394 /DNA_ORIENTATION=-